MDAHTAEDLTRELMASSATAYLTTLDEQGFPQTRAMLNLRNGTQFPGLISFHGKKGCEVYFTTNTSSIKIGRIKENNKASVYFCVPEEWRGICLAGVIELVTDHAVKKELWQKGWDMYYPGGIADPDYAVLRLKPVQATGYRQMEKFTFIFEKDGALT